MKSLLPHTYFEILRSYLINRIFLVKEVDFLSGFFEIQAEEPQGTVLESVLYSLFTCDLPNGHEFTVVTFAGDTALFASSSCPAQSSKFL